MKRMMESFFGNIENVPPFSSGDLLLEHQEEQRDEGNDGKVFLGTLRMCHLFPVETSFWSIRENKEMKGMMEKSLGNMLR